MLKRGLVCLFFCYSMIMGQMALGVGLDLSIFAELICDDFCPRGSNQTIIPGEYNFVLDKTTLAVVGTVENREQYPTQGFYLAYVNQEETVRVYLTVE